MKHLLDQIRNLPPERGGLHRGERLVVGLSGGADSVALLGLLDALASEFELELHAAHLDHQLRPESADDARFCAGFARSLGIPFSTRSVDVRSANHGAGIEATGRRLRYGWLEELRAELGFDRIALGHHLDDHAESVLMWLGRGTGLKGLAGIEASRGRIVRPLRAFRRTELQAECTRRGWQWREDATNADITHPRNALRHEVLPAFEHASGPGSLERLGAMSARASAERAALRAFARDFVERTRLGSGRVFDRAAWQQASQLITFQALRVALESSDPAPAHQRWNEARYRDVLEFISRARTGQEMDLPGGGRIEVTRNSLRLHNRPKPAANAPETAFELRETLLTRPPAGTSFWGRDRACFDAGRVTPPFHLRKVRPGDRMQPFGMTGQKKLVRLLADKDIARRDRWSSLVVEDQERIVWAVGLTTSEHTRITEDTQRIVQLRLHDRTADGKGPS